MNQMARSKRGSDENLFSISGASEALGRARRTIARAMEGVRPDAVRSGLALWRIRTIVENVNRRTQAPITPATAHDVIELDRECKAAFALFDIALEAMAGAKPLAKRRALAPEIGPLLTEARRLMLERDLADGLHEEHAALRNERIYIVTLRTIEVACDWRGTMSAFNILNGEEETRAA
jgi:hypothetical protein